MPLWAVLMSLVYLCKRKLTKVVRPTREWGPGDPQVERFVSTFRSLFDVRSVDHFAYLYLHKKILDYLWPGAEGNLRGAAQHRPRKKTQLQLKLQHWLRQSGTLQLMTHVHWGKIAWVFNLVKDNILSSSHISTMNFDCFQAISAYNM